MHDEQPPKSTRSLRAAPSRTTFTLALLCVFPLGLIACPGEKARNNDLSRQQQQQQASPDASATTPATPAAPAFDGERAFAHVRKQVEAGPRPSGSAELAWVRDYIVGELKSYGLNIIQDEFRSATPLGERKMVNVTAELAGGSGDVIIIASHYDTKFVKDFRFVGANDGGSSTGALLEIARVLAAGKEKPPFTYWFVFFDGEEAFCFDWDQCSKPGAPDNTYGSRRYVAQLTDKTELRRVRAMILLDMVGYKNLRLPREELSAAWLTSIIWQTAREMGHGAQFVNETDNVTDDHVPFLKAGVDAVDLIQLGTYPYWHTAEDTLDKVSPLSLKIVGDVVLTSLPRIEQHLLNRRGG